jgi:Leucine-rich repeat (LRR) protein
MFNHLSNLTHLALRRINLSCMNQIAFFTFKNLHHLDLSFNQLKSIELLNDAFQWWQHLEHLDLSYNLIEHVDANIFGSYKFNQINALKHLNLESNRIASFENVFVNYLNLNVFNLAQNCLVKIPKFTIFWSGTYAISDLNFF